MKFSCLTIANLFIKLAEKDGEKLSSIRLRWLVVFAQYYHLAIFEKELFKEHIRAYKDGPFIKELDKALLKNERFLEIIEKIYPQEDEYKVILATWDAFKKYSETELAAFLTNNKSPWSLTYKKSKFSVIPNSLIIEYHKKFLENG
jgi:uncharacterized phage-associated protein